MSEDKVNIFTFINQIGNKKRDMPFDKTKAPKILLCYWLSHDPELVGIVDRINRLLFKLSDEMVYEYLMASVPKKKIRLRWTKKNVDYKKSKIIDKYCSLYNISRKEARKIVSEGV